MLEPDKLALVSRLLDRVRRRQKNYSVNHEFPKGFGSFSVLLSGDFAQLQPIGCSLLKSSGSPLGQHGIRLFEKFVDVVKLRRVYRQQCVNQRSKDYRDSTLRLRDSAPSAADLALWKDMALDTLNAKDEAAPFYDPDAVWLCVENKIAGERNADVLVKKALTTVT